MAYIHILKLDGGFKHVLYAPLLGEMIQFHLIFFEWVGSTTNWISEFVELLNRFPGRFIYDRRHRLGTRSGRQHLKDDEILEAENGLENRQELLGEIWVDGRHPGNTWDVKKTW